MTLMRSSTAVQDNHTGIAADGGPIFADPQSRALVSLVERIAPTNVPVLITGEAGSGKECLARHIHTLGGHASELVVAHCGALNSGAGSALDSERAGTLFLDDVGELSPALQCALLRLLRETGARVITASSTDLGDGVANGHFRRDLFYRINIATVKLLPLRQRPGDIVPLANHFLRLYSGLAKLHARAFGQDALQALRRYPWPGNVRELENVIRFAVLTATRRELSAEDLHLQNDLGAAAVARGSDPEARQSPDQELARLLAQRVRNPGVQLYDEVEGTLVAEAFRAAAGNQVHTATLLGISRNVVRTLLKKHGLLNASRKVER